MPRSHWSLLGRKTSAANNFSVDISYQTSPSRPTLPSGSSCQCSRKSDPSSPLIKFTQTCSALLLVVLIMKGRELWLCDPSLRLIQDRHRPLTRVRVLHSHYFRPPKWGIFQNSVVPRSTQKYEKRGGQMTLFQQTGPAFRSSTKQEQVQWIQVWLGRTRLLGSEDSVEMIWWTTHAPHVLTGKWHWISKYHSITCHQGSLFSIPGLMNILRISRSNNHISVLAITNL
jgi:hypothetical protein